VGFGCQVSTALYPNWSFAKTGKASEALAKKIARALLDLPERDPAAIAAHSLGWSAPISQLKIDKLYQELDLHPLQKPWWQEALTWLKSNQQWGWTFLLFVVVLNLYHFLLEYRFSRNQRLLIATQNRLKEKNAMLEHAQRVAIVGELGGSIAHEINQPLSAIRNYSQGGLVRINKGSSADDLKVVLEKIQQQVIRADDIVQRLRSLIKKRPLNKQYSNVQALITDAVMLLDHDLIKHQITLSVIESGQVVPVYLDPIGFQQLLLNLVKNSMDACVLDHQKLRDQEQHTQEQYQIVIDTEYLPVEE
jgi:two-component system sensor histidine kinase TtrS